MTGLVGGGTAVLPSLQQGCVGGKVAAGRALALHPRAGTGQQLRLERTGDLAGDLVLQREQVPEGAVVMLGPQGAAIGGTDQLRGDAHRVAGVAHAALQRSEEHTSALTSL